MSMAHSPRPTRSRPRSTPRASRRSSGWRCPRHGGRSTSPRPIAEEAVRRLGLDAALIGTFAERFVADLERELRRRGAQAVDGATTVLDRIAAAGYAVALATGAGERSARAKLAAAGIGIGVRILVGSDFDAQREAILREAIRRSASPLRTVYVGDGLWDVAAARTLGLPFVGVDAERTGALRQADVRHVLDPMRILTRWYGRSATPPFRKLPILSGWKDGEWGHRSLGP